MPWIAAICLAAAVVVEAAHAVEPDEILADPELESRARAISQNLRCLVCQNESIDESNAPLAGDLRVLVREQLVMGRSDDEIYKFVTDRYGEFVLLMPLFSGSNLIVYLAGPVFLCLAVTGAAVYVRRRQASRRAEPDPLTDDEERRVRDLMESE